MHRRYFLLILALLLTSCASSPVDRSKPTLVTNPTERMEFHGFSILPPRGENWFIVEPPIDPVPGWERAVVFFKVVGRLHSGYAKVLTRDLPGVAAMTSIGRTAILQEMRSEILEKSNPRFKRLDVKASLDKCLGYDCLRYKKVLEDHSPRDLPGSVMILTEEGFIVPHPYSPTFFIWVEYSQRFPPGKNPFPIEAELEPFLKGLTFRPIQ